MAKTAMLSMRIETDLEKDVNAIFKKLGLSATEAVTLFYKMVKKENGLPFKIKSPDNVGSTFENVTTEKSLSFELQFLSQWNESTPRQDDSWLGCLETCTEIHGDIVAPVMDENQWEALAE